MPNDVDVAASIAFLESVPLCSPSAELETLADSDLPDLPEYQANAQQAVTVGSQISEFAEAVPAELRPHIDNAFLLAQLAANYEIDERGGGSKAWYDKYVEVLSNVGWLIEDRGRSFTEVTGTSLAVHKEIIPIIVAALGPAVSAASVVLSTLQRLKNMDEGQPWITLFDRESQRASANQFQVSYVDIGDDREPRMTLTSFELDASRSVTRVLFFKFSNTDAKLRKLVTKMSVNRKAFEQASEVVAKRVESRVTGYLTDLKI